jgi:hypothetical protein
MTTVNETLKKIKKSVGRKGTEVTETEPGIYAVRLYDTVVCTAKVQKNGKVLFTLFTGGYETKTTVKRIEETFRAFGYLGGLCFQKGTLWFSYYNQNDHSHETFIFREGMQFTFNPADKTVRIHNV